jgi:hypothetical protein
VALLLAAQGWHDQSYGAGGAAAPLGREALRELLEGNTARFYTSDFEEVEIFLAPDGGLRGLYEGRRFEGSWRLNGAQLCLDLPGEIDDGCRTVVGRKPQLQTFTAAGEPTARFLSGKAIQKVSDRALPCPGSLSQRGLPTHAGCSS